ncbi:MAG: hypothetical protein KDJ52_00160 [Anaerolineae bacterium]|nr:hypothetical protein [Anaerolineae bacterium]
MSVEEALQDINKSLVASGDNSTAFGKAATKAFDQVKTGVRPAEQALEALEKQALENQKAFDALDKSAKLDLRGALPATDYSKLARGLLTVDEALEKIERQRALDKAADDAKRAEAETKEFEASLERIERRGGSIRGEFLKTWRAYREGAIDAEEATRRVEDQMEAIESHGDKVRNFAGYFGDIAGTLALTGAAIAGPLVLAATSFVDKAGQADATSRDWLATTKELERSQQRVGRIAAQAILPVLETAADLAEKVADFAEAHPAIVKAALGVGGALLGAAAVAEVAEKGIRLVYDAASLAATGTQLLAGKLMQSAAAEQLAAAGIMQKAGVGGLLGKLGGAKGALAMGGSVLGGVALGVGVNESLAGERYDYGKIGEQVATAIAGPIGLAIQASGVRGDSTEVGFESLGKYASVGAYGAGSIFGDETALNWFETVAKWTGQIADDAPAAGKSLDDVSRGVATLANSPHAGEILESFIAYQQQETEARQQYQKQRQAIIKGTDEQITQSENQYQEQRTKAVEDFEAQRLEAEAEYAEHRIDLIEEYNKAEAEREADFQKNRQKIIDNGTEAAIKAETDYKQSVAKFLENSASQDAKAEQDYYAKRKDAAKQFDRETERLEEDHQKSMRRMRQDHNQRISDAILNQNVEAFLSEKRSYNTNRSRAEEDYQDNASRHSEDFSQRMADMEADYQAQKAERDKQRAEQLAEMQAAFQEQAEARKAQQAERLTEMDTEFDEAKTKRDTKFQEQLTEMDEQNQEETNKRDAHNQEWLTELDDQHVKEVEQLRQARRDQLDTLDSSYQEEKEKRKQAFADQVRQLDEALLGETETKKKWYEQQAKDLETFLKDSKFSSNLPGYPSRHTGGYTGAGPHNLLDGEFVMNRSATRTAEGLIGGPLSQSSLLAALGGRGGGGSSSTQLNYSPQYTFTERDDAREIMGQIEQRIDQKLFQLERGY